MVGESRRSDIGIWLLFMCGALVSLNSLRSPIVSIGGRFGMHLRWCASLSGMISEIGVRVLSSVCRWRLSRVTRVLFRAVGLTLVTCAWFLVQGLS